MKAFPFAVDAVYTWANSNDPEFQAELRQTLSAERTTEFSEYATGDCRFRDHQELRYSLRGISKFAQFFRKIFIVCTGRPPSWLDTSDGRIIVVPVKSLFWDMGIAPTYSSYSIELFLHRIPDLSEHYVYFNDDFFVSRHLSPLNFFSQNGVAQVRMGIRFDIHSKERSDEYHQVLRNTARAVLKHFGTGVPRAFGPSLKQSLKSPSFGLRWLARRDRAWRFHTHAPQPFRKSSWIEFHSRFKEETKMILSHRFRHPDAYSTNDLNHYLGFQKGTTRFLRADDCAAAHRVYGPEKWERFRHRLLFTEKERIRFFCLNDGPDSGEPKNWESFCADLLNSLYPERGLWELP